MVDTQPNPHLYKKGEEGFDDKLEEIRRGYVDAHYPGLTGYAYQADMMDEDDGRWVMHDILKRIVEIDWPPDSHPSFRVQGEEDWKYVQDTNDFPWPTSEDIETTTGEEE